MHRAPSEAAEPEPAHTGAATLADEIASAQNGAGPLLGRIRKPDAREALAYVHAHSSTEGELLEGLSKFVERWLEQVRPHDPASLSSELRGFKRTLQAHLPGRGSSVSCGLRCTGSKLPAAAQVAFPQLRDTAEQPPSASLHAYYDVRLLLDLCMPHLSFVARTLTLVFAHSAEASVENN